MNSLIPSNPVMPPVFSWPLQPRRMRTLFVEDGIVGNLGRSAKLKARKKFTAGLERI
jgi:hypothetical protein